MKANKALAAASVLLGLDLDNPLHDFLEEVVEGGGDEPPEYVFVGRTGRGRVTAKQLTEFRYCDAAITAATGEVVEQIKPSEWRKVRRLLLAAKTAQTLGEEAGLIGTTRDRLINELRSYPGFYEDEDFPRKHIEYGLTLGYPVRLDGRVWFSAEAMLTRLDREKIRYVRRELMRGLLALGCREKRVEYYYTNHWSSNEEAMEDTNRTSRTLYAVPQAVLDRARKPK